MAVLFALSIVPLLGLIGLVIDVGWAYWRKEAARTAAEAAASAAAVYVSSASSFTCGQNGLTCDAYNCPATLTSPPTDNFTAGCLYARQSGFVHGGRQAVSLQGNTTSPPVSGYSPSYWVTATTSENIPQLFSAVLGKPWAQVRVRAIAAVFQRP